MNPDLAEFSHAIKNALAVVKAYNQLLKRKLASHLNQAETDAFDKIEKQTEKIESLVDDYRKKHHHD